MGRLVPLSAGGGKILNASSRSEKERGMPLSDGWHIAKRPHLKGIFPSGRNVFA
jgi:hypothetical protein